MKLTNTKCAICGSDSDYKVLYKMNFDIADINRDTFSARRMPDGIHYQMIQCNRDRLIRSSPVLEQSELSDLYKRSRFTYRDEVEGLTATYLDALRPVLSGLQKDARILEIGCGNGFVLKALYDAGFKNLSGVEPSIEAGQRADGVIRDKIISDILRPDMFRPSTLDLICFFQTFDHVAHPGEFLKTCHSLLVPGGTILAFNHDVESVQARLFKEASPIIDIEHTYLYSKNTIRMIFEKYGFRALKVYSPHNVISLRHLAGLFPMPKRFKEGLLGLKIPLFNAILNIKIKVRLGNLCVIAKK